MKESFDQLYERLYKENFAELEAIRAKERKRNVVIVLVILAVMLFVGSYPILLPIFFGGILMAIIIMSRRAQLKVQNGEKTYIEVFKEKVAGPIIENAIEGATYSPNCGISKEEYIEAGYNDNIDRYFSDDLVKAPLMINENKVTTITFSEVRTQRISSDSDGDTSYVTIFHGFAGSFLGPKDIAKNIYIRSNWSAGIWNKNKVKMDMPEFENLFDVEGDDPILTMRILTADIMTKMIDLYKKYKYSFEISIKNDMVYIRLETGPMFEQAMLEKTMGYKQLERYYLVLKAVIDIASHIYDTISRLEI